MTNCKIALLAAAGLIVVLVLAAGYRALEHDSDPAASTSPTVNSATAAAPEVHPSFLYGRVTTLAGATYEGRLRFGGDEEAFWGDYFNGFRGENPWVSLVPPELRPKTSHKIEILGLAIGHHEREMDLGRPFMARFGDIARIEGEATNVRVTLKSGSVANLDRLEAGDFDDGVRVWDGRRGVADVDSRWIRTIELLPPARPGAAPYRLHGTVRTRQGDFTGFIQWDREEGLGTDELDGRSADGELSVRFDTISSIARDSRDSSRVTLHDGREIVLSGTREVGAGNRGLYIDDESYGRVLVSWEAFERVDFSADGSDDTATGGPAYDDFPPGGPLTGSVTTRDGRRLAGRLVYDLDESESTETLDAPYQGVDYTIPFGLIASVVLGPEESGSSNTTLTLHGGEELQLERAGDLGNANAGMLIFVDDPERPEYVPWTDVERIDLDRVGSVSGPMSGAAPAPDPTSS